MLGYHHPNEDEEQAQMYRKEIDLDEDEMDFHVWNGDYVEYQIDRYTLLHLYYDGTVRLICIV